MSGQPLNDSESVSQARLDTPSLRQAVDILEAQVNRIQSAKSRGECLLLMNHAIRQIGPLVVAGVLDLMGATFSLHDAVQRWDVELEETFSNLCDAVRGSALYSQETSGQA